MSNSKPNGDKAKDEHTKPEDLESLLSGLADEPIAFEDDPELDDMEISPQLDGIIAERDEYKNRMMRALADAENARKRADRDRRDAETYGGTRIGRDMLGVFDNLRRALDVVDDELREKAAGLIEGIELTQKELLSVFAKHRIVKIEPEFGDKFDPQMHQAMFEAPVPGAPAGTVIQVMNVGFMIADRLLRPAQVGVSSTPASQIVDTPPEDSK